MFFEKIRADTTIYLICDGIDGPRLIHLYEMCLINRESMFQSLKLELNQRFQKLLPIIDYLNFLHELQQFLQ